MTLCAILVMTVVNEDAFIHLHAPQTFIVEQMYICSHKIENVFHSHFTNMDLKKKSINRESCVII